MIYLLHGENNVDSRRFLLRLRAKYSNIVTLVGKNLKKHDFKKALDELSYSLFDEKTAVEIEQFNGDFDILPKVLPKGVDLIIWSDKKIEKIPREIKAQLFNKRDNVSSFKFVDALLYKNEKEAQILASTLLNSKEPVERLLGTVNRSLYLLFFEKDGILQDENIPSFVRKKIAEQSAYWTRAQIRKAMLYLLKTDLDIKDGVRPELAVQTFISWVTVAKNY